MDQVGIFGASGEGGGESLHIFVYGQIQERLAGRNIRLIWRFLWYTMVSVDTGPKLIAFPRKKDWLAESVVLDLPLYAHKQVLLMKNVLMLFAMLGESVSLRWRSAPMDKPVARYLVAVA